MNFERLGIPKIHFGQGPQMTTSISREQELSLPFQEAFLGFRYLVSRMAVTTNPIR